MELWDNIALLLLYLNSLHQFAVGQLGDFIRKLLNFRNVG